MAEEETGGRVVVIKVLKAHLHHSHIGVGWMSPYARVSEIRRNGTKRQVSQTSKHRRGHKDPVWEHTCEALKYNGPSSGERLLFQVLQDHLGKDSEVCGEVVATVDSLLEGSQARGDNEPTMGLVKDLPLKPPVENLEATPDLSGTISVQALLVKDDSAIGHRALAHGSMLTVGSRDRSPATRSISSKSSLHGSTLTVGSNRTVGSVAPSGSSHLRGIVAPATGSIATGSSVAVAGNGRSAPFIMGNGSEPGFTMCDPGLFEMPVSRMGVSGGTSAFYRLLLSEPEEEDSEKDEGVEESTEDAAIDTSSALPGFIKDRWVGKDFLRAMDEVTFYETSRELLEKGSNMGGLLNFILEYAGVIFADEEDAPDDAPAKRLLVLGNLRAGCSSLRMLDVKIGERTAAAGWQGKSRLGAISNSLVDGMTNSAAEGFRLEGFDGAPPGLKSMDPLLDVGGSAEKSMKSKAHRIMLQRMPAAEMLMHFVDVHQKPEDPGDSALESVISPVEFIEIILNECVRKLTELAIACRQAPSPQKWIGSSVMMGFDQGHLPSRSVSQEELRSKAKVRIFDWGRSELTTLDKHLELSSADQSDRAKFWKFYCRGIDRLAWESARAYSHRFGNDKEWTNVVATIFDFDSMSQNDFMGRAVLHLKPTETPQTVLLLDMKERPVNGNNGPSRLTYSISYRSYPEGSRLTGSWRVCIIRAENLPVANIMRGDSDPFVSLTAECPGSDIFFRQQTSVVVRTLNPEWNEVLDLPLVQPPATSESRCLLSSALGKNRPVLGGRPLRPMLPPEWVDAATADDALKQWTEHLDEAQSAAAPSLLLALAEQSCRHKGRSRLARIDSS